MKAVSYKSQIIRHLFFSERLSCTELSEKMQKSLPFVNKKLNELKEEGYVQDNGFADSTGGRRPATYSLKPDLMYIAAVAVDQLYTRIAIMDMAKKYVGDVEKFDLPLQDNPDALSLLKEKIEQVIHQSGINKTKIAGIGIGMPGFIDVGKGVNYTFFKTTNENIVDFISRETDLPVFIGNDSSIIALAELKFGAAHNQQNAMVINMGWGVGLGMILKGEPFSGENGFAGEFSHIPLFNNNKLCSCGKSGCLETEASLLVIVEKAVAGLQSGRRSMLEGKSLGNAEQAYYAIIHAALNGDKFAVELLSEIGYHIGRGVAILIHLLNPSVVILSGRGASAGKIWRAPVQQALNEHCIPRLSDNTKVEISTIGAEAEIIGAAALVMENFLHVALSKSIFAEVEERDYTDPGN